MKRIFIALKIEGDENLLRMVSSLKTGLANEAIRWTSPANIHITLAFPGNTDEKKIALLDPVLNEKCRDFGQFEIVLRGLGVFKNLKDPHIIWTGIDPSAKLANLNSLIIDGLRMIDVKIEDRPFSPHLTLGRMNRITDKAALKILLDNFQNKEIQKILMREVILFESILNPAGSVYNPLGTFKL